MLEERYQDASIAIADVIASSSAPSESAELALLYADQARCLAQLGRSDLAREHALRAKAIRTDRFDADDRALIFDALRQFHAAAGEDVEAAKFSASMTTALREHCETTEKLASLLGAFAAGPKPAR